MATTVHRKLTYEEFQELPREDGRKHLELIDGEVFVTPAPKTIHQIAAVLNEGSDQFLTR